jgi:hypothetical protein
MPAIPHAALTSPRYLCNLLRIGASAMLRYYTVDLCRSNPYPAPRTNTCFKI